MDKDDPVIKKTELVIDALHYAKENSLDIQSKDDVKKILESLNQYQSTDEDIQEFMRLLQAANALIEIDVDRRSKVN